MRFSFRFCRVLSLLLMVSETPMLFWYHIVLAAPFVFFFLNKSKLFCVEVDFNFCFYNLLVHTTKNTNLYSIGHCLRTVERNYNVIVSYVQLILKNWGVLLFKASVLENELKRSTFQFFFFSFAPKLSISPSYSSTEKLWRIKFPTIEMLWRQ